MLNIEYEFLQSIHPRFGRKDANFFEAVLLYQAAGAYCFLYGGHVETLEKLRSILRMIENEEYNADTVTTILNKE